MAASNEDFDLIVIGCGPAGEKAGAQAAYFGKRVAVIEGAEHVGGSCINTGTVPSKTLRESALYFSGVTYTTVGYGDLVLPQPWRLLAPLEALVGILMVGLSTGLFIVVVSRLVRN